MDGRSEATRSSAHCVKMEAEGIDAERVDLLPLTAGNHDHLATYSQMDISLDPWPYAGTTTTCESLFMGVPVISLAGASRHWMSSSSFLTSDGLLVLGRLILQKRMNAALPFPGRLIVETAVGVQAAATLTMWARHC